MDDEGELLLIDSHDGPVADAVWKLYEIVVSRGGAVPTLIEWDSNIPDWPLLRTEAAAAQTILDRHADAPDGHAALPAARCQSASSYAGAFASALMNPARPDPFGRAGPERQGRRQALIMSTATTLWSSLVDALTAIYPAVQRITGVEFFRAMARFHVRDTPPHRHCCSNTVASFPPLSRTTTTQPRLPWLADIARIERAWLDAYHAAEAEPLSAEALASMTNPNGWPT